MYYDQAGWTTSLSEVLTEIGHLVMEQEKIDAEYRKRIKELRESATYFMDLLSGKILITEQESAELTQIAHAFATADRLMEMAREFSPAQVAAIDTVVREDLEDIPPVEKVSHESDAPHGEYPSTAASKSAELYPWASTRTGLN